MKILAEIRGTFTQNTLFKRGEELSELELAIIKAENPDTEVHWKASGYVTVHCPLTGEVNRVMLSKEASREFRALGWEPAALETTTVDSMRAIVLSACADTLVELSKTYSVDESLTHAVVKPIITRNLKTYLELANVYGVDMPDKIREGGLRRNATTTGPEPAKMQIHACNYDGSRVGLFVKCVQDFDSETDMLVIKGCAQKTPAHCGKLMVMQFMIGIDSLGEDGGKMDPNRTIMWERPGLMPTPVFVYWSSSEMVAAGWTFVPDDNTL